MLIRQVCILLLTMLINVFITSCVTRKISTLFDIQSEGQQGAGNGMAIDANDNIYLTGAIDLPGNTYGSGQFTPMRANGFLEVLSPDGNCEIFIRWGGACKSPGLEIAAVDERSIIIGGKFDGTVDLDPGPDECNYSTNLFSDCFLSKLDGGMLEWTRVWGSESNDAVTGVAIDDEGNIFVTGFSAEEVDLDPGPGMDVHPKGTFLSKFNSDGDYLLGITWDGISEDLGLSPDGSIFICGYFSGNVDLDPGSEKAQFTADELYDAYISKLDYNGNFLWAQTWSGGRESGAYALDVDEHGNVYSCGYFGGPLDIEPGPFESDNTAKGDRDALICKLNPEGVWLWIKTWGNTHSTNPKDIELNSEGDVFVTGTFQFSADFDPDEGEDIHTGEDYRIPMSGGGVAVGNSGMFVSRFSEDGDYKSVITWSNAPHERPFSIAADSRDKLYITGESEDCIFLQMILVQPDAMQLQ